MNLTFLKSKLHRGTVTRADLDYEGSVTIAADLMQAAHIHPNERVEIYNISNGARIATYAITGEAGSGEIGINGAAAHMFGEGDLVILCTYCRVPEAEATSHSPTVVLLGEGNNIKEIHHG